MFRQKKVAAEKAEAAMVEAAKAARTAKEDAEKTRYDLFKYSYEQVLDATKHQDDKIGRLLTAIAFLTAAALALAAFGQTKIISTVFNLGSSTHEIPVSLGLVFLTCYLIGIVVTVIQLIGSLSTPLRLPGMAPEPARQSGTAPSTLYFHEIEKTSRDEWRELAKAPAELLQSERTDALVRETRNLAARTSFKYNRTNEATAVFTWSLIALALTVTTQAIVAMSAGNPLQSASASASIYTMEPRDGWLLGGVLALSAFVWFLSRLRHEAVGKDRSFQSFGRQSLPRIASAIGILLATFIAVGLALSWGQSYPVLYQGSVAFLTLFAASCMAVNIFNGADLSEPERRQGSRLAVVGVVVLPIVVVFVLANGLDWRTSLGAIALGGALAGTLLATYGFGRIPALLVIRGSGGDHAGSKTRGAQFAYDCPACRQARAKFKGRGALASALAVMLLGAVLAAAACSYGDNHLYVWPLTAGCGALTLIALGALLSPTFMERQDIWHRRQRKGHNDSPSTAAVDYSALTIEGT